MVSTTGLPALVALVQRATPLSRPVPADLPPRDPRTLVAEAMRVPSPSQTALISQTMVAEMGKAETATKTGADQLPRILKPYGVAMLPRSDAEDAAPRLARTDGTADDSAGAAWADPDRPDTVPDVATAG
jgi:hypothetical protein